MCSILWTYKLNTKLFHEKVTFLCVVFGVHPMPQKRKRSQKPVSEAIRFWFIVSGQSFAFNINGLGTIFLRCPGVLLLSSNIYPDTYPSQGVCLSCPPVGGLRPPPHKGGRQVNTTTPPS